MVVSEAVQIGPGGRPLFLYVLYGDDAVELICTNKIRFSEKSPTANFTVGSAWFASYSGVASGHSYRRVFDLCAASLSQGRNRKNS